MTGGRTPDWRLFWALKAKVPPNPHVGKYTLRCILAALVGYANDDGIAFPSQRTLADDLELHRWTIRHGLEALEAAELIVRDGVRGHAVRYRLRWESADPDRPIRATDSPFPWWPDGRDIPPTDRTPGGRDIPPASMGDGRADGRADGRDGGRGDGRDIPPRTRTRRGTGTGGDAATVDDEPTEPPPPPSRPVEPPPRCRTHHPDFHQPQPCRPCGAYRRWAEPLLDLAGQRISPADDQTPYAARVRAARDQLRAEGVTWR